MVPDWQTHFISVIELSLALTSNHAWEWAVGRIESARDGKRKMKL